MTAQTQTRPLTPRRKSKLNRVTATDVCILAFLLVFSGLVLYPFYNSVLISMTPQVVYIREPFMLWPKALDWSSYQYVFENKSIWMGMWTTVQITIFGTLYNIFLTVTMAYALNHSFPGKKAVIALIMFTMYFTAGTIPDYLLMNQLHMLDTIWCLILPLCFAPYNLLIMKNNFQGSIPESLIESARLDGASHFTILAKIVVPLSKPIMATIALFYAVGRWNAYSDALYYIKQNVSLRPLQLKLYYLIVAASESFQSEGVSTVAMTNPEVLKAACIIFAAVPIICVYPFIQKYFVQGTMVGAVKG